MDVHDFLIESTKSNISKIVLRNRYPQSGYARNTESEMVAFILEGSVELFHNEERKVYTQGDVVCIKVNKRYYWEPQEYLTLLIFSTPPWTHTQQELL